jgi:hypothetical protein
VKLRNLLPLALVLCSPPDALAQSAAPGSSCTEWRACRDLAEQARAAGDYEAFHDLAWRAVQTRRGRDPELFFLLARAQSLSGRPNDAMVTLQRLAQEMHVAKDVSTDEEFRRVRALPGWPEVEAIIAGEAGGQLAIRGAKREGGRPDDAAPTREGSSRENRPEEPSAGPIRRNHLPESAAGTSEEVARFPVRPFVAGGLAYDAVSRRFVIGNLPERKLTIVEEGTNRAATLSGDAARLLDVRALEIDRRQGDLWVVSGGPREGSADGTSELHKLQLVSGRVLTVYAPDPSDGPSQFVDVAVGAAAGVLVLDAAGPRLVRPLKDGRSLARVMTLPAGEATSLAPADDGRTVYIAYADRVARADLITHHVDHVVNHGTDLSGFTRLRWHKGSLVGVQTGNGSQRIVQIQLSPDGWNVKSARRLDRSEAPAGNPVAVDILQNEFYYLVPGATEATIRRIRLK